METNPEEKKTKLRYRNIVRQYNRKTGAQEDIDLGEIKKAEDNGDIAFTFRRITGADTGTKDGTSEIDIEADGLRELLKEQIGADYPGQNFDGDTVEMSAPFTALVSAGQLSHETSLSKRVSTHFYKRFRLLN